MFRAACDFKLPLSSDEDTWDEPWPRPVLRHIESSPKAYNVEFAHRYGL